MTESDILRQADDVLAACRARKLKLAVAESCTGGLLAGALTAIAGSSDVFERGFATYSNEAKSELLGVPMMLIEAHGAVSAEVARAMADGALAKSRAQLTASITGVAGPGGGSDAKPVGLVFIGCAGRFRDTVVERHLFPGDRTAIRHASVMAALALLARRVA